MSATTTGETRYLDQARTLEELVFQALGAASMCWENPAGAGVFESDRAKEIGDELLARLREREAVAAWHAAEGHCRSGLAEGCCICDDGVPCENAVAAAAEWAQVTA